MSSNLLEIKDLQVQVGEKMILNHLNLTIPKGETHILMGPNGAGKSTLGSAIMGSPVYSVTSGQILFENEDITDISPDQRAKRGLFLSFQNPQEVNGVGLEGFIRTAKSSITGTTQKVLTFHKELLSQMERLEMNPTYAERSLNVGFSGGEKKKSEILQMLLLQPKLAILDETDSGLDVDAIKTVSKGIREFRSPENSLLIITHNAKIIEGLQIDKVHILGDQRIIRSGGPELVVQITEHGFRAFGMEDKANERN